MKTLVFLAGWMVCWCITPAVLRAQQFAVTTEWLNGTVYIGFDNRIEISPERDGCDAITVTADAGELKKDRDCRYFLRVSREGRVTLKVQQKINGKLVSLGSRSLPVKYFPPPVASVGGRKSGPFPLVGFKLQTGVVIMQEGITRRYFEAISFGIKVYRNRNLVFETTCAGPYFNNACKNFFQSLRPGDTVIIDSIRASCTSCRVQALGDLTYIMT